MRLADVAGIAAAQRVTRAVIHDVAETLVAGDTERSVVERLEGRLVRAGVRTWLHTPYAWFGERTRFAGFHDWEPDALPTERRLAPGDPFILDAAPFVDGHPADYAFSGVLGAEGEHGAAHQRLRQVLERLKERLVEWARAAPSSKALFETLGAAVREAGFDVVHALYPAAVLGHRFDGLPRWLQRLPRVGWGFQPPLVVGYGLALARHRLAGAPYPFINHVEADRPVGVFAVEPHIASGSVGAKFESVLVVDGDETRWLDPGLFGEVRA
jgi:Xaa-Pro aminopeptidase